MASRQLDEEAIFHIARQLTSADARATYLDQVCAGDASLRDRVEALLKIHEQDQAFLNPDSPSPPATADAVSPTERPGATIGRYRLMEQIGEGGMGVVFVAEQEKPIRRKVALKVIKPGMDSKAVVARFEAERQALAMMDHPNIAKVLDAGTTDSGRPYFAMELVRGISITDYCDRNRLTIQERLSLFIEVCQAIQHAHQKGIIHRDIKPSNVLVTLHDGTPVPKVIDFGVAKALNTRLTDRTIYTEHLQVIGTLLYMSPEQAELSGLDVDTRSDVYSLGVVLYELLTGTTPFQKNDLEKAGLDEQRRIIRDEEPPRASIRISSLGETVTIIADSRKTDPKRLHQMVRGDLDWIVTKALEKDRTRRYKTADSLALDVARLLADEPIEARPPSRSYRLHRFLRRNRVAVTAGGVVSLLILSCTVVAFLGWLNAWQAYHALERVTLESQSNARRAQNELHQRQLSFRKLADASYSEAVLAALAGDEGKAETALHVASEAGISSIKTNIIRALLAINAGRNDEAIEFADHARIDPTLSDMSDRIAVHALLITACCYAGYDDRSFQHLATLRTLQPQRDIDYLFMAYAELLNDPQKSLDVLENAPTIQRSSVGLFLRGIARIMLADQAQDADLLEKANRDLEYVQLLFRDNQCAWLTECWHWPMRSTSLVPTVALKTPRNTKQLADWWRGNWSNARASREVILICGSSIWQLARKIVLWRRSAVSASTQVRTAFSLQPIASGVSTGNRPHRNSTAW
ncbi:MAG: serine/threonine protein kinase [Pirellulaceae bacterium]